MENNLRYENKLRSYGPKIETRNRGPKIFIETMKWDKCTYRNNQ